MRRFSTRRARGTRALLAAAALAVALPALSGAQDTTRTKLPPGGVITLQDAIRIALAQNTQVRFARNSLLLDSLAIRQAKNAFLPNLSASSSASQDVANGSGGNPFSASIGASSGMTIYNGGQNRNILSQARTNAAAGAADVARTRQSLVFTVASDYLALITQQQQLRVQQENLTAQEQELTQLQEFVRRGTRPIGDLYQQQAAVASTRLAMVNARRATEVAKVNLIQELVLDPRLEYTFATPVDSTAVPADTTAPPLQVFNLDSLITVAFQQRVDLRAQALRVQAAQTEIAIAEGGRKPTVSGSAGYGTGYNSGSDQGFATQLNQRRGGSVGVNVSVPILDRGAVSIARQRAQVQLENELLTMRDLEQSVALDVRRAYLDYLSAGESFAAATAQERAAALALQAAQTRYRVGLATLVEVTLARASLIQAQSAVVSARSSLIFQQALMSYYTGALDPSNVNVGI
ncbi:MAG TPA: TolC family protein [Gemmatimonadaceae bacterium]